MNFVIPSKGEVASEASLLARGELFDGIGRRRIIHPDDVGVENPRLVGYTRATSYIGALEDTTALEKWRTRLILEGASDANLENAAMTAYAQFLDDERLAREKLEQEESDLASSGKKMTKKRLSEIMESPGKNYRATLDELAELSFCLAGGRESADYGTAHHELVDRWLAGGLDTAFMKETEERWPGILDDFDSFRHAWNEFASQTGARVDLSEALVVNDDLKVAGRTDLIVRAKLPGDQRARRVIMDLKTGKIEGEMRLSQQLDMYASSKLYDPETGERSALRVRRDVGIIIHSPKGQATTSLHLVQLRPGRAANALCAKVRASRRKVPGLLTPLVIE